MNTRELLFYSFSHLFSAFVYSFLGCLYHAVTDNIAEQSKYKHCNCFHITSGNSVLNPFYIVVYLLSGISDKLGRSSWGVTHRIESHKTVSVLVLLLNLSLGKMELSSLHLVSIL